MEEKRAYWKGLTTGLFLAIIICALILIGKQAAGLFTLVTKVSETEASEEVTTEDELLDTATLTKIQTLTNIIDLYYLEDVDQDTLREGIYSGLLDSLGDPYSVYYSPEEFQEIMEQTEGIYYGIGAYISTNSETGLTYISGIIDDTPASESGLMTGDQIYKVDGEDVTSLTADEVVMKIRGEEGTQVILTVIRDGESDVLDFTITRQKVETPTVTYQMYDDQIAYISILEFDEVTYDQFKEALDQAKEDGMLGLVLDLRDNPGGNLSTVNDIARLILPEGLIVYTEDKYGQTEEYTCDGENELTVPLVVLVNGNSASASEILTGAIKDYQKGTILGTTTYGKGIVQKIMGLDDGSAVKVTVSKYYTPNGNNIHKTGITPDIELEFDSDAYINDGTDNQLERALELLRTGE